MFERYTEKARRVIFFARYEASQFGANAIETEHILLGLLREDKSLMHRLPVRFTAEGIRRDIEEASLVNEKVSTSVDLPLSGESQRVLDHAAEEARGAEHAYVGTEHLLIGLLREPGSFGAVLLLKCGVTVESARQLLQPDSAVNPEHSSGGMLGGRVSSHIVRRWLEIVSEADGTLLGKTPAINIPAVGAELVFLEKRYQVRRVAHHFTNNEVAQMLWPEKIVVHVAELQGA
jgi:hypothetical protein